MVQKLKSDNRILDLFVNFELFSVAQSAFEQFLNRIKLRYHYEKSENHRHQDGLLQRPDGTV